MDPNQLSKEIGSGKFRPVYYFFGDEDYRKKEALKYIVTNYIPGKNKQLSVTTLSADKVDLDTITGEIAAISLLAERRVICVENVQKLKPPKYKKLFSFLQSPPPETIVVLSSPATSPPNKKSAFFREVQKIAAVFQFSKLTQQRAKSRIVTYLQKEGYTYDDDAVELLASLAGGNFGGLTGELEKLSLSGEAGSHIGIEEVKKIASSYEEFGIFQLVDLIADRKYEKALQAYRDLLLRGSSAAGMVVLIGRQMVNVLKVVEGHKIAGNPYWVSNLRRQASLYGRERTLLAISKIAETERKIRHSSLKPDLLVENLILEISR